MRFDWYQATLPLFHGEECLTILRDALGGELVNRHRGMNGYTNSYTINGPEGVSCTICAGGINRFPNAFASAGHTQAFVDVVRGHWPGNHNVTRMDSAEDFEDAKCWDKLSSACISVADRLGLKVQHVGDWHRGIDGRTLYIGSRKSPCFVRLYEKGKQMRQLDRINAANISPDWVRLEAQIHPDKHNRDLAATVTPMEAWGFSTTTQQVAEACLNEKVARVEVGRHDKSEHERAMNHAAFQYGKIFTRERLKLGSWPAFGEKMHKRLQLLEAARRAKNKL